MFLPYNTTTDVINGSFSCNEAMSYLNVDVCLQSSVTRNRFVHVVLCYHASV